MAITSKTFTLVGDLKRSTNKQRTQSILSFSPNIAVDEEAVISDLVPTGTVDQNIPLGKISVVTILIGILDDQLDGTLSFKINGADTGIGEEQFFAHVGTNITSLSVSNNSGNDAAYTLYLGGS